MKFLFTVFFVAVLLFAGIVAILIWRGASARSEPAFGELWVGRTLRHFAIPEAERKRHNPIIVTTQVMSDARAHWADHCAICHGNDGSGNTEIGRDLYPKAPDMRGDRTQKLSDGELFCIIKNGVRLSGMPGWGGDDADNWKLVHFVRHLPKVTPDELRLMKSMNPLSREEREEQEFLSGK